MTGVISRNTRKDDREWHRAKRNHGPLSETSWGKNFPELEELKKQLCPSEHKRPNHKRKPKPMGRPVQSKAPRKPKAE